MHYLAGDLNSVTRHALFALLQAPMPAESDSVREGQWFESPEHFIIKDSDMSDLRDNASLKKYNISMNLTLGDTSSQSTLRRRLGERDAQGVMGISTARHIY